MNGDGQEQWAPSGPATLFLLGVLHLGLFAFATSDDRVPLTPVMGLWILAVSAPLLILGVIEMRRGEVLFGTMGIVFGGLLGLGAGLSFIRALFLPGPSVMDGYWFLGTSIIFFLLIPAMLKVSKLVAVMLLDIGVALFILGLSLANFLGTGQLPMTIAGWLALFFSISCFYVAMAQMTNAVYGRRIMPF
ncbi:MAG: hypothetical protein ISF22_06695 [Methanomassiliicoccus sp.]|nr:hypothetical protein [Methanomassiliicoccus sp.]